MKTSLILAASLLAVSAGASAQVGVSIHVGEPGFYGRIDIGQVGPPPVVYQQPIIVQRPAHYVEAPPLYLRVPPGHQKHWEKHCREYNACGQRVLFVREDWYVNEYAPRYRQEREAEHGRNHEEHGKGHGRGHDRDHDRGHDRD